MGEPHVQAIQRLPFSCKLPINLVQSIEILNDAEMIAFLSNQAAFLRGFYETGEKEIFMRHREIWEIGIFNSQPV